MGQVYRARDSKLKRDVAIKVLPADFAFDANRATRFRQEAEVLASLNHPHIASIYDFSQSEESPFLVMELVEGETLEVQIRRGPLPMDEVLKYGAQMADALAEAHKAGIVHRDLKPGNVMITRHGVKVLDFGLAKPSAPGEALTQTGVVMGTPAYMAPEQTQGRDDTRADLFALGLVLYEMLAGQLPIPGASLGLMLSESRVSIPPLAAIRADVPAALEALVLDLLSARPEERPQSADDVRKRLEPLAESPERGRRRIRPASIVAAVAIVASILVTALWLGQGSGPTWELEGTTKVTPVAGDKRDPDTSPSGAIAFSWRGENGDRPGIYVIPKAGERPVQWTESSTDDFSPRWSPDGSRIAFLRMNPLTENHELRVVEERAGAKPVETKLRDVKQRELLSRTLRPLLTWTPDGSALVVPIYDVDAARVSLYRVPLDGSPARRLFPSRTGVGDTTPSFSPEGRWFAFTNVDGNAAGNLYVSRAKEDGTLEGEPEAVPDGSGAITSPSWSPDGSRLLFARESQLMEWTVGGDTRQIYSLVDDSFQSLSVKWDDRGAPQVLFANQGHPLQLRSLALDLKAHRAIRPSEPFLRLSGWTANPALSPNRRWVAFASRASGEPEIWMAEADGKNPHPIAKGRAGASLSWSRDSRHLAFHQRVGSEQVAQIWVIDIDEHGVAGEAQRITHSSFGLLGPEWSADGTYIYATGTRPGPLLVVRVPSAGGEVEELFAGGSGFVKVSADGRTLFHGGAGGGIFSRSLEGNAVGNLDRPILPDWKGPAGVAVTDNGIVYVGVDGAGIQTAIRYFDFALKRSFDLAPPPLAEVPVMTLSPDNRTLIYQSPSAEGGDLTLMQFRSR
jgi:serine/threonine protein kinase